MKIGINNIFTTFWFLLMLIFSGTLTFLSISRNIFTSDLFMLGKIVIGFMIFFFIGILFYLLYKFRILIIHNNKIISIHPFWFKKEEIDLKKIKKLELENFFAFKGTVYRKVIITDSKGTLEINDLEFENFEMLTSKLKVDEQEKNKINLEQAKSNLLKINFNIYVLFGLLIFLVLNTIWNGGFYLIIIVFLIFIGLLLYASVKRRIKYKRIKKTVYNNV